MRRLVVLSLVLPFVLAATTSPGSVVADPVVQAESATHRTAAWAGLQELTGLIRQILESRRESRALPEPRGGYL